MRLWKWIMKRFDVSAPTVLEGLADQHAEQVRKLNETERAGREIRGIADVARRLREQNNFAAKLNEAFGRPWGGD